ncbi:translocon-associated protein subunit delta [Diabrotica virgifera virgifera]|uniref:Translocon-associated protein subunit delta n=1 Tax=Diabrotica virgifera virgifera TaxID=50390 RepID=A0A6P7G599_DIAVI|nr:translocon-associated protein subunit delta [Diabrotica virgifera virgifera]
MSKATLVAFFTIISASFCLGCTNPEVSSKSFTTLDATIVTNIAYISEFSIKCGSGKLGNLYAALNGHISPVSLVGNDKFQVSWTEDIKTAKSGDRLIKLYDEEGYVAYKKASRANEDVSSVPSFADVVVTHSGAYNGPWLKSEFIATILSLIVAYVALASRAKVSS